MIERIIKKIDNFGKTPKFLYIPGKNGAVEISEMGLKRGYLYCHPVYLSVTFVSYDTSEEELFSQITRSSLSYKKKSVFGCTAPQIENDCINFPVTQKLVRMKLSKEEDLRMVFALESLKSRLELDHIDSLDFWLNEISKLDGDKLTKLLDKVYLDSPLNIKIPILRLSSMLPAIDYLFDYESLIYRAGEDIDQPLHLTEKMLNTSYLCIQARILNPEDLDHFSGWGLHLMTVQDEGGLGLSFVTKEIKNWCSGRKVSRKLTALTREAPDPQPWLLDEQELAEILRIFEEAKIEPWISVDGNFTNRVYIKSNGSQAALITESTKEGRFNSLAFIQPYDYLTYKFIRCGQTSYYK